MTRTPLNIILILFAFVNSSYVYAENYVWIIGGGPYLKHSQSQIELNIKWAIKTIKNKNSRIKVFFTDGNDPAHDVMNYIVGGTNKYIPPLDHIYGGSEENIKEFYNHSIPNVSGTTEYKHLQSILIKEFKKLDKNDRVLIFYNGHGGSDDENKAMNYLRLWNDSRMTVINFEKILSNIKPTIPTRFIMTQCYSGAFGNAIYKNANLKSHTLVGKRCGFMAEAYNRESEGCSGSLKIGDYRDYSTYFFAALSGKNRQNKPLKNNPDIDKNGYVNLYEAHLYTLENAYSTDLSRSTSEQYLENWEPWYLRWIGRSERTRKSHYFNLAIKIAKKNNIPDEFSSDIKFLSEERAMTDKIYNDYYSQDEAIKKQIKKIQNLIAISLEKTQQNLKKHYKNNFSEINSKIITTLNNEIKNNNKYIELRTLFEKRKKLVAPLLDAERKLTQIEKIIRMLKLAKLEQNFKIFASEDDYKNYNSLLSCEKLPL